MATLTRKTKPRSESRRSRRLPLHVPVLVYGRTPENKPFRDHTHTLNVDAHGARITVAEDLVVGQTVLLVNSFTQEERECRVVHVGAKLKGRAKVGIEFADRRGNFWHVYNAQVASKLQPADVL